jgi:hypothetical protein
MTKADDKCLNDKPHLLKVGFPLSQSGRGDLNPGPRGPDPRALPSCATPRKCCHYTPFGLFGKVET